MKRRTQNLGHRDAAMTGAVFDLMDPPSIEDRPTPLPVHRIMVIGDDVDGSDDAPTVAVASLAELGIDPDELRNTSPGTSRRSRLKPYMTAVKVSTFDTPDSTPVRDMTPVLGASDRKNTSAPDEASIRPLTMVAAASVPIVAAACAAAWWILAA